MLWFQYVVFSMVSGFLYVTPPPLSPVQRAVSPGVGQYIGGVNLIPKIVSYAPPSGYNCAPLEAASLLWAYRWQRTRNVSSGAMSGALKTNWADTLIFRAGGRAKRLTRITRIVYWLWFCGGFVGFVNDSSKTKKYWTWEVKTNKKETWEVKRRLGK